MKKQKILQLYKQGKSYSEIAEILSCSKGTISFHCRRAGISKGLKGLSGEEVKISESDRVKKWRKELKARAVELMGGKCSICGYNKCLKSLEFHHLNPSEKDFSISKAHSWSRIVEELKKCIIVCANCHGEIHYKNN